MSETTGIATDAGLKIVKVSAVNWRTAMDKGMYTCAPPLQDGQRRWKTDDLVILSWYDTLVSSGMKRTMAGPLAGELFKAMAVNPEAGWFNVYTWILPDQKRGGLSVGHAPPADWPDATLILQIPLAQWRVNIRAATADYYWRRKGQPDA